MSKTVFVTGASGGIGREISFHFADAGWNVICHYNSSKDNIDAMASYFRSKDIDYHFLKCDFSIDNQFVDFIKKISSYKIDSIINNAGISIICNQMSDIEKVFKINVFSAMVIVEKCFEKMKNNKFGRIVNISSIGAKYGSSISTLSYGCSKRAIEGITKTFAKEGASYNVLVNTVRPGVIDTDFHKNTSKDMNKRVSMIPVKKMGKPNDISKIVYMLGSEENDFITNEIITVAGGE